MKIKKLAAASLALCIGTLSGMSALAANVYTTTDYTYDAFKAGTADAMVTVNSKVTGAEGGQIAYLVCGVDAATGAVNENEIYYIDQATASADGVANFTFKAKQSSLYGTLTGGAVAAVAKFGSDNSTDALSNVKFEFNPGANSFGDGTATADMVTTYTLDDTTLTALGITDANYTAAFGKVSGNAKEYGFKLTYEGTTYELPAAQSKGSLEDGSGIYCIVVNGIANATLEAYVK